MGCWPIAGITSINVSEASSLATLEAAADVGINHFDTAYCYGYDGESERMVGRALGHRREELVIATKGGIHWENKQQAKDASPARLKRECDESLSRLGMDVIDLYYLHSPDPNVPITESAGCFLELLEAGKIRSVGVSNTTLEQMQQFASVCPIHAYQPRYNMLQRQIETSQLPWCRQNNVAVMVYWPLMKGLLAGKIPRDHQFDPADGRQRLPMFQGAEWDKNQDFLDELRVIASEVGLTVAQLVVYWTVHQPGVTTALCGAKRPEQIRETADSLQVELAADVINRIDAAIEQRGPIAA